ncbi:MAG: GNAT family N-acetyltransferase [Bellilinea sp.]
MAAPADFSRLAEMRWDFRTELAHEPVPQELKESFIPAMLDFLAEAHASGRWGIWAAELNGLIVSHVYIQRIRKVPRPSSFIAEMGYLTNMFTYPAYRGKGIGAELLHHALAWSRSQKLEMIILWPAKGREEFYIRGGFNHEKEAMTQDL